MDLVALCLDTLTDPRGKEADRIRAAFALEAVYKQEAPEERALELVVGALAPACPSAELVAALLDVLVASDDVSLEPLAPAIAHAIEHALAEGHGFSAATIASVALRVDDLAGSVDERHMAAIFERIAALRDDACVAPSLLAAWLERGGTIASSPIAPWTEAAIRANDSVFGSLPPEVMIATLRRVPHERGWYSAALHATWQGDLDLRAHDFGERADTALAALRAALASDEAKSRPGIAMWLSRWERRWHLPVDESAPRPVAAHTRAATRFRLRSSLRQIEKELAELDREEIREENHEESPT
jgi:hypothetical protein